MPDPITLAVSALLVRELQDLVANSSRDYLKNNLATLYKGLEQAGRKDEFEAACTKALEEAYAACVDLLVANLKAWGCSDGDLREYRESLQTFVKDEKVAAELFQCVQDPNNDALPSPAALADRWITLGCRPLPEEGIWNLMAAAFRRRSRQRAFLSPPLRDALNARNVERIRELLEQQAGVPHQACPDLYAQQMRRRYAPVDLANLTPSYADDPGSLVIRDVFVGQTVREDPPPVEIPKDLLARLRRESAHDPDASGLDERDRDRLRADMERLRARYVSQSPQSVLDVGAAPGDRLLVLTGEPGSGKSTLMRYLLLGVLEPPRDASGQALPWTAAFESALPLLIEVRDFYALRRRGECDTFLEYLDFMGRTQQWGLEARWLHDRLEQVPTLVMFDGLDEIFAAGERERGMQESAGCAGRYARARVGATTRPVGYRDAILRGAGFRHFGIQDLDEEQIERFIGGWFALTFPRDPDTAGQRVARVLESVRGSRSIRLLAGNPMLLTMMALLAREQELPRERAAFYEKSVELLCHQWDANRNLRLQGVEKLNVEDKKGLLRRVAVRMQGGPGGLAGNFLYGEDLEETLRAWFVAERQQPAGEATDAARAVIETLHARNHILCLRGPRLYGFVHRTFLEFLTAADTVRRFAHERSLSEDELVALFDAHCRDEAWREVLRLICGQIDEKFVGRIVTHLATRTDLEKWDCETPLPELPLAIWCLGEVRTPGRLEDAGKVLLDSVVRCITLAQVPWMDYNPSDFYNFLRVDLLNAARDLGQRWPGADGLGAQALSRASELGGSGRDVWPQFVAHVQPNRGVTAALAESGDTHLRQGAYTALAEHWPDEMIWRFLYNRAIDDVEHSCRLAALQALAGKWGDEDTRRFIQERAVQDGDGSARGSALSALAGKWEDEETRRFLHERAVQDGDWFARGMALAVLAGKWGDEDTRGFVQERAVQDEGAEVRGFALEALAGKWGDEDTRRFIQERAVQDDDGSARGSALEALAGKWGDEHTRRFLRGRLSDEPDASARTAAFHALARAHSPFGGLVATRDLDRWGPYLDPCEPVAPKHIEGAAQKAGIPPEQVDAAVEALNAFLGWDIRVGLPREGGAGTDSVNE